MTDEQAEIIARLLRELSAQLADVRKSHSRIENSLAEIILLLRSRDTVVTVPHQVGVR